MKEPFSQTMESFLICFLVMAGLVLSSSGHLNKDTSGELNIDKQVHSQQIGEIIIKYRMKRQAEGSEGQGWTGQVSGALDTVNTWVGKAKGIADQVIGIVKGFQELSAAREEHKLKEREFEARMAMQTFEMCDKICVTEWQPWSRCTKPCGGGAATRTRNSFNEGRCEGHVCRHHTQETKTCNPLCPNGGSATSDGCSCPRGFSGQCCTNEIVCDYPGKPQQGKLEGTTPAQYGGIIFYSCLEGYALVGDDVLFCTADGSWREPVPQCLKITCDPPSDNPLHGRLINLQESYLFEEEAHYICDRGYIRRGPESRKCVETREAKGRWTGFTPLCLPVDCGVPNTPLNGYIEGDEYTLGNKVSFSCEPGYRLEGSAERRCLPSGKWSGHEPVCNVRQCEKPLVPDHGSLVPDKEEYRFHSQIRFRCETGYILDTSEEGSAESATCQEDPATHNLGPGGVWSAKPPRCQAAICGDPHAPENGAKDGSLFYYPHEVSFTCYGGYVMSGASSITCQQSGEWSAATPTCTACPVDMYKEISSDPDEECKPCPENSGTSTDASTSIQQCTCKHGYKGEPGETCQEIRCPVLSPPSNGMLDSCDNNFQSVCEFQCESGHIMDSGSAKVTCLDTAKWSGDPPVCKACPKDTYKSDERSCLPCPTNAHTDGEASVKTDCTCNDGYIGPAGGICVNINECIFEGEDTVCDDVCRDIAGSYICECSIPGYIPDPLKPRSCIQDKACRNLTIDDAPENGGLVCHWYTEQNSQHCSVRCNKNYEFPSRVNNYETCGPTTGYMWTHEERGDNIDACIEEFFPDFRLEADSFYFVRACPDLTEEEKNDVRLQFATTLSEEGICIDRASKVCNMEDVDIICGRVVTRNHRGKRQVTHAANIAFNVTALKIGERVNASCDEICDWLGVPPEDCEENCWSAYKRKMVASVLYARQQIKDLFRKTREKTTFDAANRHFESSGGIRVSDMQIKCPPFMSLQGDDLCVPCVAGTKYEAVNATCKPCPLHHYQDKPMQAECIPCPLGSWTDNRTGMVQCLDCPPGMYGEDCGYVCELCVNGKCDPRTGQCVCKSGWMGPQCDIDIPGCKEDSCYGGVVCLDIRAPGTGFKCAGCPEGMVGDGVDCTWPAE